MDKRTKEVRTILTGFIGYDADGAIIAAKNLEQLQSTDFFPGAENARLFGVRRDLRQFAVSGKAETARQACAKAFSELGLHLALSTAPDALGMLHKPLVGKPVVVTLEQKGNEALLCVYTARTPFGFLRAGRMLKRVTEALPKTMSETKVTLTPQNVAEEAKQAAAQAKKAAAEAKKAAAAQKKAEKKAAAEKKSQ